MGNRLSCPLRDICNSRTDITQSCQALTSHLHCHQVQNIQHTYIAFCMHSVNAMSSPQSNSSTELVGLQLCYLRDVVVLSLMMICQNRKHYRNISRLTDRGFSRINVYTVSVSLFISIQFLNLFVVRSTFYSFILYYNCTYEFCNFVLLFQHLALQSGQTECIPPNTITDILWGLSL